MGSWRESVEYKTTATLFLILDIIYFFLSWVRFAFVVLTTRITSLFSSWAQVLCWEAAALVMRYRNKTSYIIQPSAAAWAVYTIGMGKDSQPDDGLYTQSEKKKKKLNRKMMMMLINWERIWYDMKMSGHFFNQNIVGRESGSSFFLLAFTHASQFRNSIRFFFEYLIEYPITCVYYNANILK